jgi:Rps23 Pro-64 3,4-dihydroxylase Tpa1-like proline 4-hydroxylase
MVLALAPRPDVPALTAEFAATGTVSLTKFLTPTAADALLGELASANGWLEIFRAGENVYEMPHAEFLALSDAKRADLRRLIEQSAKEGLQYRYRAIRVADDPDERSARGLVVDAFADLLNRPETLGLLRTITGNDSIALADAQATDYRAGDFLTSHDDAIAGKRRRAAYVFGLTREWQPDWGGLLLFENGDRVSGFVPEFNVLRLFAVPARHHVSLVAPWVEGRRLSITGWLRAVSPPTG